MKDTDWTRVPLEELSAPQRGGLHNVVKDRYWQVDKDGNVFFFQKVSPQCNQNKVLAERLKTHPDMVGVVFVPLAMYPVSISDYV